MPRLRAGEQVSYRIGPGGLVIGRSPRSDIVVGDEGVSRSQAIVLTGPRGVELLVLGRAETQVNGRSVRGQVTLRDGDRVDIADVSLIFDGASSGETAGDWVLELPGGGLAGLSRALTRVGGGARDDVQIPGLPEGALVVHRIGEGALVELPGGGSIGEHALPEGAIEAIEAQSVVAVGGVRFRVVPGQGQAPTTAGSTAALSPVDEVELRLLPDGARLMLQIGASRVRVDLSELRARLLTVLLQPPGDYEAGDFVPDELLLPAIWPGQPERDRISLNQLVHRLRGQLLRAGVDPRRVLERPRQGGSMRFRLFPSTRLVLS